METLYDLIITAGRLFSTDSGLYGPGAVAIRGDRIVACGTEVNGSAVRTLHFPNALLLPGLVDMHAHPARSGSRYGVDPDEHFLPRGVTTCMSQGDAGALNWSAYRDDVVQSCRTRVRLALHLSKFGESRPGHCFEFLENADVDLCVDTITSAGPDIWGIAFNATTQPTYTVDPREIVRRGIEAAERSGSPVLYGPRLNRDFPLEEQLPNLRAGDLMTYTFTSLEDNIINGGKVRKAVLEAKERGVLFDAGHGMRSFSFPVAETAIAEGFHPDTISTDQYNKHINSNPQHDLPRTMSKFIAAGMSEVDVFECATSKPAELLGLKGEVGTLAVGACADIAVLQWNRDGQLSDVDGIDRPGGCWEPVATIRGGNLVV